MKFAYKIICNVAIDKIKLNKSSQKFTQKKFDHEIFLINSDILNEHYYYGMSDLHEEIKSTFDTDLKINIQSNSYEITHVLLSNNSNLTNEILKFYDRESINLNSILESQGCDLKEIYDTLFLEPFVINDANIVTITIQLFEFTKNDYSDDVSINSNDSFEYVNLQNTKFIKSIQIVI